MLLGLKIENIAVIESAGLEFGKGLNVLTGETGAGKSIVIDSINAVLGERTSRDLIRTGCDSANVSAVFKDVNAAVLEAMDKFGIEKTEDGTLTVNRSISLSGKNTCRINGWPVTVTQLREIGSSLINIHGQHDSQALLSPEKHCPFIDSMAGNSDLREEYKNEFHKLIKVKKELDTLYDSRDEKTARADYLDFVIKEITDADIKRGESEELNKEKLLIQNSAFVKKNLDKAFSALSGDDGIAESLGECAALLEKAAEFYDGAAETAKAIKGLSIELSEQTSEVRNLSEGFGYSPSRLTEIDDRLDVIYRLSMKYGKTEDDILETLEKSQNEKALIGSYDERIEELEKELYSLSDRVKVLSEKLTDSRKKASKDFEKKVAAELAFLDMPYVTFSVNLIPGPLTSKGAETAEFLISANPGQEPKPISKIASGGELSRIMLAIKNVLSDKDTVDTLIFDEIDSGVSGSAAEKIALKLDSVSKGRQVICVTHLARIAAQADVHMKIEKNISGGSTFTEITPLDFEGRASELARINAGTGITGLQIEGAKEMLNKAKETKK